MRNLVFTTMLSFFTLGLYAQSLRSEGEFYGGIKGGINYSKVTSLKLSTGADQTKKTTYGRFGFGFQGGGFAGYHFSDDFALQLEALYSLRNAKTPKFNTTDDGKSYSEIALRTHYVEVPLLVKYYPIENLYLAAGPQLNLAVSMQHVEKKFADNKEQTSNAKRADLPKEAGKKINFAGVVALGYDLSENFTLEGRYVHGFAPNVYDEAKSNVNDFLGKISSLEVKGNNTSMFQLSLGYTF